MSKDPVDFKILGEPCRMKYHRFRISKKTNRLTYGDLEPPGRKFTEANPRRMRIHDKLSEKDELHTTLHEFLHGLDWYKDEHTWVEAGSKDLADFLWKMGYRKVEDYYED